jgi:hypothetical protein
VATIPPRDGAAAWGNEHPRDAILAEIEAKGRADWKEESGYHRRRIAENMMFRLKQLGDRFFPAHSIDKTPRGRFELPSSNSAPTSACPSPSGLEKPSLPDELEWGRGKFIPKIDRLNY